ncbi:MAG TPA: hypothetical protein VIA06_04270 [Candidatus Dormibacteraeota bacterium]|jgi:hypothetical protein|nr:hypothetical protein [Candidatus Dormibacteraeota bacterium]
MLSRARLSLLAAGLLLLLCACGTPKAKPKPTPSPTPALLAVRVPLPAAGGADNLEIVTLKGSVVAQTPIPAGTIVAGAAAGRVVYVVGTEVHALLADGGIEKLSTLPQTPDGRVVLSPDGSEWMWAHVASSGTTVTSQLYVDGNQVQKTTLSGRALDPVVWTARGAVVEQATTSITSTGPFDLVTGPTELLNPQTGRSTALTGAGCLFAAMATDGTLACRLPGSTPVATQALHIQQPDGHLTRVDLPGSSFAAAGGISFEPSLQAGILILGGATSAAATANGQGERYETDVVYVLSGTMRPYGRTSLRPGDGAWAWLPDGSLVAYRPPGSDGGPPGVYVLSPLAVAHRVLPSGTPVGVIEPNQQPGGGSKGVV